MYYKFTRNKGIAEELGINDVNKLKTTVVLPAIPIGPGRPPFISLYLWVRIITFLATCLYIRTYRPPHTLSSQDGDIRFLSSGVTIQKTKPQEKNTIIKMFYNV
jgi:hypothetical protein